MNLKSFFYKYIVNNIVNLQSRFPTYIWALCLLVGVTLACVRHEFQESDNVIGRITPVGESTKTLRFLPGTYMPGDVNEITYSTVVVSGTPTPDATRPVDVVRTAKNYTVVSGDTLSKIARAHRVSITSLRQENNLNTDLLSLGQVLIIPNTFLDIGSDRKLIPDSELVYGPGQIGFDVDEFLSQWNGYVNNIVEIDHRGITRNGSEIINYVSENYSVNPRLLIVVLENKTGWVKGSEVGNISITYPFGYVNSGYKGLLRQLSWAADVLNYGFYSWMQESLHQMSFDDGTQLVFAPGLNAGTVAVQYYFSQFLDKTDWNKMMVNRVFDDLYADMFGDPFGYGYEPLLPSILEQPPLKWPWSLDEVWYFTGGPHGGWDSGSAWAGIDFGPPEGSIGCQASQAWIRASTDGRVVRSSEGAVVQDLDGDGYEQTGWNLIYMHIDSVDRVELGRDLRVGDLIGHVSCEGGYSSATHLHFSRKYNGVWIAADDPNTPFNLDGWLVESSLREYDGWLVKGDRRIEAWYGPGQINSVILP